jgi:outer membrane protein TolC
MSRTAPLIVLILLAAAGCKQNCFVATADLPLAIRSPEVPEPTVDPALTANPLTNALDLPAPSTIDQPDAERRYLGLAEALAIALERGTVGINSPQNPGSPNENLVTFQGGGVGGSDSIRVLALDPARAATDIEATLSRFDARWISSMNWVTTDTPIGTSLQEVQAGGAPINAIQTQAATFNTAILKPLPTGGVAGITFRTDYTYTNVPSPVNPAYQPLLRFQFEQPLLQGFGVEINQLRSSHPGSLLTPFNLSGTGNGILLARINFDESRAEFERNVQLQVLNVEAAYWTLYGAYWALYSRELGFRQAHEIWRRQEGLAQAGQTSQANSAQARGQYELFRSQRLAALAAVLEAERRLRLLLGLPREDGTRLIPADAPVLTQYQPDWKKALDEALAQKPELYLARQDVKYRQLSLLAERNALLPDLRFTSTYELQGLGSRLDGPSPENAINSLVQNHFQNWTMGLRLEVPIGYREANARVRSARLLLARSMEALRDQENKVASGLQLRYRQLFELHAQIRAYRAQREAYGRQLEVRYGELMAGRDVPLPFVLEAQRSWSDALANEYSFVVQYNTALAGFEQAKGTILNYHNIMIAEGGLPQSVQIRAVQHEKERTQALVLRERALPVPHSPASPEQGVPGLPLLPQGEAPSLPSLLQGMQSFSITSMAINIPHLPPIPVIGR